MRNAKTRSDCWNEKEGFLATEMRREEKPPGRRAVRETAIGAARGMDQAANSHNADFVPFVGWGIMPLEALPGS